MAAFGRSVGAIWHSTLQGRGRMCVSAPAFPSERYCLWTATLSLGCTWRGQSKALTQRCPSSRRRLMSSTDRAGQTRFCKKPWAIRIVLLSLSFRTSSLGGPRNSRCQGSGSIFWDRLAVPECGPPPDEICRFGEQQFLRSGRLQVDQILHRPRRSEALALVFGAGRGNEQCSGERSCFA